MITGLIQANVRRPLPYGSRMFQAVILSPPYFNLRDYSTPTWTGGDPDCQHLAPPRGGRNPETAGKQLRNQGTQNYQYTGICQTCGATRQDDQLGLEETHDCYGWATGSPCGECFTCRTVSYMREVSRVLRDDGIAVVVIGDSYVTGGKDGTNGLKQKDLIGIPWSVAFALRADGWYLRSETIWHKTNPMPESVEDRPTKAHETVFIFSKSPRYFWDSYAVREVANYDGRTKTRHDGAAKYAVPHMPGKNKVNSSARDGHERWPNTNEDGERSRNIRSVLSIPTQPYKGSHYATFPERLVEIFVKAGTSEKGACPTCGSPWERVISRVVSERHDSETQTVESGRGEKADRGKHSPPTVERTLGWLPSCNCYGFHIPEFPDIPDDAELPVTCETCEGDGVLLDFAGPLFGYETRECPDCHGDGFETAGNMVWQLWDEKRRVIEFERVKLLEKINQNLPTRPCIVLDPFAGSGTTVLVAKRLGRSGVGSDLSFKYLTKNARKRVKLDEPRMF